MISLEEIQVSKYWFINENGNKFVFKKKNYLDDEKNNHELTTLLIKDIFQTVIKRNLLTEINGAPPSIRGPYKENMAFLWDVCNKSGTLNEKLEIAELLKNDLEIIFNDMPSRNAVKKILNDHIYINISNSCTTIDQASRIVFMHRADYSDEESLLGLQLYVMKHPKQCFIVNNQEELINALEQKANGVTLVLVGDNNRKDQRFLDWTLDNAGREIGQLVHQHPCIEHVRLISCHAGKPNSDYIKDNPPVDLKRNANKPLSDRAMFIYDGNKNHLPFDENALASQIWQTVMSNHPTRELSISASPNYLHLNDKNNPTHFIGSSIGAPFGTEHEFKPEEDEYTKLKTITLSTQGGVKAVKLTRATDPSQNIAPEDVRVSSTAGMLSALQFDPSKISKSGMAMKSNTDNLDVVPSSENSKPAPGKEIVPTSQATEDSADEEIDYGFKVLR